MKIKKSIYYKFLLGYILFALISILYINTYINYKTRKDLLNIHYDDIVDFANKFKIDSYTTSDLDNIFLSSKYDLIIVDKDNSIKYSSLTGSSKNTEINIDAKDYTKKPSVSEGNIIQDIKEQSIVYSVELTYGKYRGYAVFLEGMSDINYEITNIVVLDFNIFCFMLLASFAILIIFHLSVYKPLKKISVASKEYAKGNLKYKGLSKFKNEDEIGNLGVSLNYMAKKLDTMEEDQKNFLSNVSHDFRSPLTSIKGYAEAIKDGTIPYEMQDKYLDIILFETNRLTKLTQNILSLNSWDSTSMRLELSTFPLHTMVTPIVDSLENKCLKRKVHIRVESPTDTYMVNADKEKMEQVLYNLLDNAIKFSHSDSTIILKVYSKNDKIFISVKDSGIGISKDSLDKIWDRFYKTDASRGKDKTGSGLGLSITKEIINAHGENINVISTENVGTEFIFSMKKA